MTYDFHGSWESKTGFHTALYSRAGETADEAVMTVVRVGAPPPPL